MYGKKLFPAIAMFLLPVIAPGALPSARVALAGPPSQNEPPPDSFGPPPGSHMPGAFGREAGGRMDGPPRRHRRGDDGRRPRRRELSQSQRKHLQEFTKEHFPRMYSELQRLRERNTKRYKKRIADIAPRILHIMETMGSDPEEGSLMVREHRLGFKIRHLSRQYRRATDEDKRSKLRDEVRKLCAEEFDCRQALRERGIRKMDARIAELRDRHKETAAIRDRLIDGAVRHHLDEERPVHAQGAPPPLRRERP